MLPQRCCRCGSFFCLARGGITLIMFKLRSNHKIVVLTGAGISAESGIRTFRECNGLWEQYKVEDVATPEGFDADPELVWRFYNDRIAQLDTVEPNDAHRALAKLENVWGENLLVITQNVDNLHERAGTKNLLHMHGELLGVRCSVCSFKGRISGVQGDLPPKCEKCGALLRPDIVWFGEMPYFLDVIQKALAGCDLFMAIGTSGVVYPAAGFLQVAGSCGARTVVVNPDFQASGGADEFIQAKAGKVLPELVQAWIQER